MATACFCPRCGAENAPGETRCHACQHLLDAPPDIQENTPLLNERYRVLAEIGAGGFGAVYKARDTREGDRIVAVKQINLKGLSSQEIIEATDAFNREAEILSTLSHPLLPRIFDRFSDPEHWYLVMTFIEGSTLDEYLQQQAIRTLPARAGLFLEETLTIGLHVCDALRYLHSQQPPVIFRDLKPGNIMRTASGRLYLIDFGIARRFKPGQAKDTIPFGSPGYAAPEQYGKAQTTPQADIYSLGALLYCLISGDDPSEHPFQFPHLRLYGIDGIRELDALIQRMVALDTARRPADIQEVEAELKNIQRLHASSNQQPRIWTPPLGQTPLTSSGGQHQIFLTPSSAPPPTRKTSRRRVLTVGLLAGGAALAGGILFLANQQSQPLTAQSQPPGDQNQISSPVDQNQLNSSIETEVAQGNATATASSQTAPASSNYSTYWSPDMTHRAIITPTNQIELYVNQTKKPLKTIQLSSSVSYVAAQWSPNNQQVALFMNDNDGYTISEIWDANSAQQIFTLPNTSSQPGVAWSSEGQYLAIGCYSEVDQAYLFALFHAANGKPLFQEKFSLQAVTCLAWTPDNQYILFPTPTSSSSWVLEVWSNQTHQQAGTIASAHAGDLSATLDIISAIACSPVNNQVAFIYDGSIWLGNLRDGKSLHQLSKSFAAGSVGNSLVWSPNGKYLAVNTQGNLSIWNVTNGQGVHLNSNSSQGSINAFAWAADSKSITVADNNNVISRWSVG